MNTTRFSSQVAVGIVIIAIGVLLLIGTTGVADFGDVVRWIPSAFILLGLWALVTSGFRNLVGPLLIIGIAAIVQIAVLGGGIGRWWPVILIVIGVVMLMGWGRVRGWGRSTLGVDTVNAVGIFGGPEVRVTSRAFKGGQLTAIMGGVELDLRNASVEGRPATIDATVIFGGIEIKVPPEWNVKIDALTLFGGSADERKGAAVADGAAPDLVITGTVLFGGISVKD